MRTLVVYYSRTGTTRDVAGAIARAMNADLEEIVDTRGRGGLLGFLRSAVQSSLERSTPIQSSKRDPHDYDLVIVGTPVWAANVSSPVRAYLSAKRGRLPLVAFFCTMGGRGGRRALAKLGALTGASPVARLLLREGVSWREGQRSIAAFVDEATAAVETTLRRSARENHGSKGIVEDRPS